MTNYTNHITDHANKNRGSGRGWKQRWARKPAGGGYGLRIAYPYCAV